MNCFKARFDGKVLVPVDPVDLPTNCDFEVEMREAEEPLKGSAQAIVRAVRAEPHISREDIEALVQAIEGAKLPVQYEGIFDEEK
jgi:hypothetical protein